MVIFSRGTHMKKIKSISKIAMVGLLALWGTQTSCMWEKFFPTSVVESTFEGLPGGQDYDQELRTMTPSWLYMEKPDIAERIFSDNITVDEFKVHVQDLIENNELNSNYKGIEKCLTYIATTKAMANTLAEKQDFEWDENYLDLEENKSIPPNLKKFYENNRGKKFGFSIENAIATAKFGTKIPREKKPKPRDRRKSLSVPPKHKEIVKGYLKGGAATRKPPFHSSWKCEEVKKEPEEVSAAFILSTPWEEVEKKLDEKKKPEKNHQGKNYSNPKIRFTDMTKGTNNLGNGQKSFWIFKDSTPGSKWDKLEQENLRKHQTHIKEHPIRQKSKIDKEPTIEL